jgi:hypothetical protein
MGKIEEKLLSDFKKSNTVRKLKLAKKFSFESAEEYLGHLLANTACEEAIKEAEIVKVVKEKKAKVKEEVLTDIVIAFDTTGSMSSYIEAVKKHVIDLIPTLFKNTTNLQLSIVAFGDYCDMNSSTDFGKAYQVIDLTDNEDKLIRFVKVAKETGGGDGDEFYELVLQKIRLETSWRARSNKSILLIADCDPHSIGYSCGSIVTNAQIDWKQEAKELSNIGVKVDTLACTGAIWYKELSKITNGIYLLFSSSEKTSQLLEGYSYARSGATTAFTTSYSTVTASGDVELIGVYKQLGTL